MASSRVRAGQGCVHQGRPMRARACVPVPPPSPSPPPPLLLLLLLGALLCVLATARGEVDCLLYVLNDAGMPNLKGIDVGRGNASLSAGHGPAVVETSVWPGGFGFTSGGSLMLTDIAVGGPLGTYLWAVGTGDNPTDEIRCADQTTLDSCVFEANSTDSVAGGFSPYFLYSTIEIEDEEWVRVAGGLKQISVGGIAGYVWGVNDHGEVFFRPGREQAIPYLGWIPAAFFEVSPDDGRNITQVSVGGAQGDVFGIGKSEDGGEAVFYRDGITNDAEYARIYGTYEPFIGNSWAEIDMAGVSDFLGYPQEFVYVSAGGGFGKDLGAPRSTDDALALYAVTATGEVYTRVGITSADKDAGEWSKLDTPVPMQKVEVAGDGKTVWGLSIMEVDGGYQVYFYDSADGNWMAVLGLGAVDIATF